MKVALLREMLGEALREQRGSPRGEHCVRCHRGRGVSLGYLSEVERGQKEASSELILAICTALELPQSELMKMVSDKLLKAETKAERQVTAAA